MIGFGISTALNSGYLSSVWEEFCCQQTGDEHQAGTDKHTEFSPSIGPDGVKMRRKESEH